MCAVFWFFIPVIRFNAIPSDMLKYAVASFFCVAALHSMGVLFATVLDDQHQWLASSFTLIALMIGLHKLSLPSSFDPLLVLTRASPLVTHTMPWLGMGLLLIISAILLLASAKVVESREY